MTFATCVPNRKPSAGHRRIFIERADAVLARLPHPLLIGFATIASIVVLVAFGAMTFWDVPRVQANLPTPWTGLWERINISVFLLWVAVLATVLLRGGSGRSGQPGAMRWTT